MGDKSLTWKDLDPFSFAVYGTLYVLFTDLVLYPADLLTTRLQADKFSDGKNVRILSLTRDILRREGVPGLYRGFTTLTIGSFPGQLSYYLAYEYANHRLRRLFGYDIDKNSFYPSLLANATAGFLAEGVSVSTYLPTDIISQRLQMRRRVDFLQVKYQNRTALSIIQHVHQTEGIRGFYRGFIPYMIVFGPGSSVWWASYELSKHSIGQAFKSFLPPPLLEAREAACNVANLLVSGAIAGIASCIATNPLDVARTRMQLLEVANSREKANLKGGFINILQTIYRTEGIRGLYKGMKPRVYVRIPGSAVAFLGYEYLKQACRIE